MTGGFPGARVPVAGASAPLVSLLLAAVLMGAPSCVTGGQVASRDDELGRFLDGIEAAATICAPRELALARANLAFAVYESDQGQTTRAWEHLDVAEAQAKLAWSRSQGEECERDSDLDGLRDSKDRCPAEPEDFDGDRDDDGCPETDTDGDGLDDEGDRCPTEPEDVDGFMDDDGCPDPDNDGDGIKDEVDQCVGEPEDRDGHEDIDGCPDPDNDADGIKDVVDKCPNQPEDMDGDRDTDGCPDIVEVKEVVREVVTEKYKTIVVTETKIELKQKVFFATGKARILKKSYDLLDEVAMALRDRPQMRVRIEGHTDSRGSARKNLKLSQRRADSVRDYMVAAGVDEGRLVPVGFGEDVPIDTNRTRAGRAQNRRVEFHIID